jgi:molybdopterin-biosynthesis enzyme MoeA-like protein
MTSPRIGLYIIGDEILSGRRQDKHFPKVLELLSARGLRLSWVKYLGDEPADLTAAFRQSFASQDIVFSCGGIGSTPDDHTRQCAAEALGLPLVLHPEAEALITQRCVEMAAQGLGSADMNTAENRQRLTMGEFPQGAEIVPNPYNRIPGFHIARHTFVPGFPVMAWPMIEATLDGRYASLHHGQAWAEPSFLLYGLAESQIAPIMVEAERLWPGVKTFSLPSVGEGGARRHIELGAKGPPNEAAEALQWLRQACSELGGRIEP